MEEFKHNNKDVIIGCAMFIAMIIFMAVLSHLLNNKEAYNPIINTVLITHNINI